jgi:hypothetical protein
VIIKEGIAKYADGLLAVVNHHDINIICDQGCKLPNPDTAIKLGKENRRSLLGLRALAK